MPAPGTPVAGAGASSLLQTIAVPYPAGITAGQLLVLMCHTKDNDEIITPAGWSQDATNGFRNQTTANRAEWFYKVATGSESGTLTVSKASATTTRFVGRIWRIPDVGTTPYEATAQAGAGTGTTGTPADVTTTGPDRRILVLSGFGALPTALGDCTGGTLTVPENEAEFTAGTGGTAAGIQLCSVEYDGVSLFDVGTQAGYASSGKVHFTIALMPSAGAPPAARSAMVL